MSWYTKNKHRGLKKLASMDLVVRDYQYPQGLNTILEICFYLMPLIGKVIYDEIGEKGLKEFRDKNTSEFIAPDGTGVFDETGIINFYVNGLSQNLFMKLIPLIRDRLEDVDITTGSPSIENFGQKKQELLRRDPEQKDQINDYYKNIDDDKIRVVRFPITENINKYKSKNEPPTVNMSSSNAGIISEKILQIPIDDGFSALDLKNRLDGIISNIDRLSNSPASRYGYEQEWNLDFYYVRQKLIEIRAVAEWAVANGYEYLTWV